MSTIPEITAPDAEPITATTADPDAPGIRPAAPGIQPVRDLTAFLRSLPDFGEDAARMREAIAEDRELRRRAVEADDC